ncbi:hypothetical protein N8087_01360 [Porticoccaceae bacterium]|nr:hypothetical protein [Porticoccaceae bacterium]
MFRAQVEKIRAPSATSQDYALCTMLHSNLAAATFDSLQTDKRLVVLDLGMAMAATVDYFSQFKSKLIFVDLYSESFVAEISEEVSHQHLVDQFRQALAIEDNCIIDICLFWDFFNYLDGTLIKAFIEALQPYLADHSRGFGLGALNSRCQLPNSCYGLMSENTLTQCPRSDEQRPVYPHSQRDLNTFLDYFEINKSRLMSDGRVEYLITRCNDSVRVKKPIF